MKFYSKFSSRVCLNFIVDSIAILAVLGSTVQVLGFMWDASSHIMRKPETFWSIQHITLYSGIGMFVIAAILGAGVLRKNSLDKRFVKGIVIIMIGACIPVFSGYADWIDHEQHGLAAEIVSIPHIGIELGPAIVAFGGFLMLKQKNGQKMNKLVPVAILSIILSVAGDIFNLALFFYGPIMCMPVHQVFFSGCEIQ